MTAAYELRTVSRDDTMALVQYGPVLSAVFFATPEARHAEAVRRALVAHKRAHPRGAYIHVVAAHHKLEKLSPDDATRAGFGQAVRDCDGLSCVALVIELDGFLGAAVRAVMSGVLLTVRIRAPLRIFDGLPKASRWASEQMAAAIADAPTPDEIASALAAVRK